MLISILTFSAFAAEIDLIPLQGSFGAGDLEGRDGWVGGYKPESWPVENDGGDDVTAGTDDGADGVVWGVGDGMDNWLVQKDLGVAGEGGVEANFQNLDDDSCGVVHSVTNGGNLYLAIWSDNAAPPPVDEVPTERILLYRVEAGTAVAVGKLDVSIDMGMDHLLRLARNDGTVSVSLDGVEIITYADAAPLPAGFSGFYAFQNGAPNWGDQAVYFEDIRIFLQDDDADGIADDTDNCEQTANPDQADANGDLIGDACQDTGGTGGTGGTEGDADADADSDSDTDGDADSDADIGDPDLDGDGDPATLSGEVLVITSGCDTTGGAGWLGVVGALAALGRRRR